MKADQNQRQDDALEALLRHGLVSVPIDFSDRVMHEITAERIVPATLPKQSVRHTAFWWRVMWQWLGLLAGTVLGASELAAFVFGIWAATAAG